MKLSSLPILKTDLRQQFLRLQRRVAAFLRQPIRTMLLQVYPYVFMIAVPTAVLWRTLLSRGYILRLDMIFTPHTYLKLDGIQSGFAQYHAIPRDVMIIMLNFFLPMDIVQKGILFGIFFLCVYSVYAALGASRRLSVSARITAGALYAINPFTYDRLMAGHWWFLLGYSLLPFMARAVELFFAQPDKRTLARVVGWWSALIILSIHHAMIGAVLLTGFAIVHTRSKKAMLYTASTVIGVLILNMWWIIPELINPGISQSYGVDHFYAFASRTDLQHGIWFNLLALHGFWFTDWQNLKDIYTYWEWLTIIWLTPVFAGIGSWITYSLHRKKRLVSYGLVALAVLILSAGPHPPVGDLNRWIFMNIPGFSGMRESQKFLSLLVYVYAVLAAYGLDALGKRTRKIGSIVTVSTLCVLIAVGHPMLLAGNGQLTTHRYPDAWHEFHATFNGKGMAAKAIVLPWDLYTTTTFTDSLIANPARSFFGPRVIQSQKASLRGVVEFAQPETFELEQSIQQQNITGLLHAMRELGAEYVLVTDTNSNTSDYEWINTSIELHQFADHPTLTVYKLRER